MKTLREETTASAIEIPYRLLYFAESTNQVEISECGRGTFGIVSRVEEKAAVDEAVRRVVAMKKSVKDPEHDSFRNERSLLSNLDHPHIVRLYGLCSQGKFTHQIMESCADGELFNLIATKGALDETLAKSYLHQILLALNYMHSVVKVIHRDLKPENVLLTQGCRVVKLCDFGTAVKLCSGRGMKAQGRIGSLSYAAPEVYSSSSSDFASDMWSSGVLLYVMMCAASPFRNAGDTHPEKTAMERVKKGDINKNREKWKTMPSGAKKLLLRLLQLESEDRPSAHEALQDEWFADLEKSESNPVFSDADVAQMLMRYSACDEDSRRSWLAMAYQMPEWDTGRDLFERIDIDQDGVIGSTDLSAIGFGTHSQSWFSFSDFLAAILMSKRPEARKSLVSATLPFAFDAIKESTLKDYRQYSEFILMYSSPMMTS